MIRFSSFTPFFFSFFSLFLLIGCAAPTTAYTVALPEAVGQEAQVQEQMIQQGGSSRKGTSSSQTSAGLDRGTRSFSVAVPPPQRLAAVAERIMIAAAPYCGTHLVNAYPVSIGVIDRGFPVVINAASPLEPQDRLVAMDGRNLPSAQRGYDILTQQGGAKAATGQPLQLTARRNGRLIHASYTPLPACAIPLILENHNQWNAYADGEVVHIEQRLLSDLTNDDDLGFVIAHELAHNLLSHVQKQQQNAMAGAMIGLGIEAILSGATGNNMSGDIMRTAAATGGMTFSQDFEREADYVGLYILAAAGYDLEAGPRVARRIARQDPRSIRYASSHPSSADRAASLQATIREIQQKAATGQPIMPNPAPQR